MQSYLKSVEASKNTVPGCYLLLIIFLKVKFKQARLETHCTLIKKFVWVNTNILLNASTRNAFQDYEIKGKIKVSDEVCPFFLPSFSSATSVQVVT